MKTIGFLFVAAALLFSCTSQKNISTDRTGRLGVKDSTEYELIVFDTGFDFWLASNKARIGEYSNDYYRAANHRYALEWNRRYSAGDRRINSYVDYNMQTDYGFDFNYKLYMYFRYFEETNRTKLVPGGGR